MQAVGYLDKHHADILTDGQQQLAEIIGVSQQSVNKYENHSIEPDIQTLITIADFFHTSVDYLIGRFDAEQPAENVRNPEERALLIQYRRLSPRQRDSIKQIIENYLDL
jgi:transcriptional regulator with XRE-family HTH domain